MLHLHDVVGAGLVFVAVIIGVGVMLHALGMLEIDFHGSIHFGDDDE